MSNPSPENNVFVEFYTDAVELTYRSEEEGRPIFEDRPFIKIIVPGDQGNVIERVANDLDKRKYPNAWKRFQSSEATGHSGTPLEQWPQITRSQLKESKYFEVHTVEQMASLADTHVQRLGMGFADLRTKAQAYLAAAAGTAVATKDAAEKERLQRELDDLKAQVAQMQADSAPRRGRKPAEETVEA